MKRNWENYVHRNRTEGDCQLVTAVNAYHHLTGRKVSRKRYEGFIDLSRCRYGSCISIEKVWKRLGLAARHYRWMSLDEEKRVRLPVEVSVWHRRCGLHSALIVDHDVKTGCFRITNFPWETSSRGWMFTEEMYKFLQSPKEYVKGIDTKEKWQYRSFRLLGD